MGIPSKKSALRWGLRVAGGVGGLVLSNRYLSSRLPAGKTFLGLPTKSDLGTVGWDDVVDVAVAITTAGFAGRLAGREKRRKK